MPNGGSIEFSIGFNVDKTGLKDLQNELNQIQQLSIREMQAMNQGLDVREAGEQLNQVKDTAMQVSVALQKAFNQDLGTVNISKFNQELKGLNLNQVYTQFSSVGTVGQNAFRNISAQLLSTNTQLKQSHTLLDSMADTMGRTIKWGVASSMMNRLVGSVQEAYGYIKNLDTSLNNIQIVTQKSAEDMAEFAVQANNAAQALGTSTTDYTNASLIYYQQGLSDEEVAARTDVTLKTANVTGQTAREVSEELTAVWNGYQKTSEEAESSIDVLAAVAANTASNLEELATGMSTVASAANTMGVSEEQLAAQLSTIISATRQGPEMTGRALRTIYARMSTINAGGIDEEDGATLTSYTAKMEKFGISVLDANGKLRDMGDVIEEIGSKWNDFTREQQVAIAQAMAGTRQYNNIMALFENWDEYTRALDIANNSLGTLQQQQDTYMESTAAHLAQMGAAWEDVFDSILSGSDLNGIIDVFSTILNRVADFVDAIGGGRNILLALGSTAMVVFSNQIGKGLASMIGDLRIANQNMTELQAEEAILSEFGDMKISDVGLQEMINQKQQIYDINSKLTPQEEDQSNALIQQKAQLENNKALWNDQIEAAKTYLSLLTEANSQTQEGTRTNTNGEEEKLGVLGFVDLASGSENKTNAYEQMLDDVSESEDIATEKAIALSRAMQQIADGTKSAEKPTKALADAIKAVEQSAKTGNYDSYLATLKNSKSTTEEIVKAEKGLEQASKNTSAAMKERINAVIQASEAQRGEQDYLDTAKKYLDILPQESQEYRILKKAVDELNAAMAKGKYGQDTTEQWEKFKDAFSSATVAVRNCGEATKETLTQNYNGQPEILTAQLDRQREAWEDLKKAVTDRTFTQSLTQMVGGFGQVASGIMSIHNLGNIITNDSLSSMEKALQITMSLTTAVTMFASGWSRMVTGFKTFSGVASTVIADLSVIITQMGILRSLLIGGFVVTGVIALGTAIYGIIQASTSAERQLESLNKEVDNTSKAAEKAKKAVEDFLAAFDKYDQAVSDLSELEKGTEEYIAKLKEANDEARELIELYGLYSQYHFENGVITFDEGALEGVQNGLQSEANEAERNQYAVQIAQNTAQTVLDFMRDSSHISAMGIREQSTINNLSVGEDNLYATRFATQQDVNEIANWLSTIVEVEGEGNETNAELLNDAIQAMGGDEGFLDAMGGIVDYDSSAVQDLLNILGDVPPLIRDNIVAIASNIDLFQNWGNTLNKASEANDYYAEKILSTSIDDLYGDQLRSIATNGNTGVTDEVLLSQMEFVMARNANQMTNEINQSLSDAIADIDVSDITSNRDLRNNYEQYSDIKNDQDLARTYVRDILHYTDEEISKMTFKDRNGYAEVSNGNETVLDNQTSDKEMRQALARYAESQELIAQYAEQLDDASSTNQDYVNALGDLIDWAQNLGDTYGADIASALMDSLANGEGIDLSTIFNQLSPQNIEDLTSSVSAEDWLGNITAEDLNLLYGDMAGAGNDAGKYFVQAFAEALEKYDPTDWYNRITDTAISAKDTIDSLMVDIQSGVVDYQNIQEYEGYEELISQLDTIKEAYPEITAACDILGRSWEVGTQKYIEALEQVQDTLFNIKFDKLTQEANDAIDEVEKYFTKRGNKTVEVGIDADPEGFYKAMDDVLNAEYAIDIELHTEAENEFNSVISAMDDIYDKANLIGDSFIVAASDIRELNNTFPGILEGMQNLGDGTVQLNEEIVQSAMNAAEMEAAADAQAAVEKLENQATLLRAKQAAYQQIADAAGVLASSEVTSEEESDEARAALSAGLEQLKELNSQESANSEMNNAVEVTDNSNINAERMASNWNSGFQSAAQSSAEFANAAIANMQAVAAGGGAVSSGSFSVNYSGASGASGSASIINSLQSTIDSANTVSKDTYAKIQEEAQAAADMAGATANDIEGMIAEIGATGSKLDNALSGIRNGGSGGSGGGGGGGGGGSGSGSAQEPNVEDLLEDEADRYHDIDIELEKISNSLSKIQKQEDKLLGEDLIDNLNKQLSLLNDQIDATNKKIEIARGEAQEYRDQLTAKGAIFDATGAIANYDEIMQAALNSANAIIEAYNAMSAEEQEAYQDVVDQAKQDYQDIQDLISKYDQIWFGDIPEMEESIIDAADEKIQINIQKFTAEIEVRLDMREAEKDWNEFYRKVVLGLNSDDIFGNALQDMADIVSYFDTTATDVFSRRGNDISDWVDAIEDAFSSGGGEGTIYKLEEQIYDTMEQLDAIRDGDYASVYGNNAAQAFEDLQTYYNELMDELEDIYDLVDDIKDAYLDMIDEAIDKFDEQIDQYEYINDLLNHDVELIGLLYGDDAYAEMARYYQQIEDNNNQELDFLRKRVDYAYEMMQAETDDEARKKWQEEWEDALSQLNDKVEDSVQNIIDKYSNAINQIISELNDAVTNGLGLDYVSDEWDLINQAADIYLDQINEAYEIQAIRNKYLEAIDATDSVYAQQKLNEAMEMELSYLEEKDNLTQTDVDRAELLYQITLAQIALDEAQQNKSTMRLRRDSQGNYSYQYVSDQDEVAQAQQELLDLQNQLYNFDKDAYQENLDDLYSIYEEFQEKLLELYEDQTLSAEEREQQIALYVEYYGEIINDLVTENTYLRMNLEQSAFEELAALYDVDVENFRNMSEEEIDELMTNLIPQWDSGVQHMADTFAGEGGFIPTCEKAFEELNQATLDYQDSLDLLEQTAGIDFDSIATGYDMNIQLAEQLLEDNDELIESYRKMIDVLSDLIAKMEEYLDVAGIDYATRTVASAYNYTQDYNEDLADAYREAYEEALEGYSGSTSATVVSTTPTYTAVQAAEEPTVTASTTQGNGIPEVGDTATYTGGLYYYDSYGTSPTGSRGAGGTVTITQVKTDGRPYPIHVESTDSAYGWLKQSQLSGYDTGGYTGEWENGDDGAVALLHQKELVLNQTDTENILTAVGLVRDMSAMLSALDTSVLARMSDLKSSLIDNLAEKFENGNQELEQNVHIEASFPNVRDSQEIEDAFNNLVNIASMHAYRTQR